jgi:hypothetical protein
MKKLVLGSLALAAFVTQTTGCVISDSDPLPPPPPPPPDEATISAEWSFHTVNQSGQLSPDNGCPTGFNTVALHNQQLDANDRPLGPEVIDLFDCIDRRNFSDPLHPGVYETFISVTNDSGATIYADSLAAIVDVTEANKTFTAQIADNGGYFKVGWEMRDAVTSAPLECRDVAGIDGVEIASTLAGTTMAVTDIFDCDRLFDFSAPIMEGTYVVSMSALNTAGAALGQPQTLTNKDIRDRNQVTDLGTVVLPID